MIDTDKYEGHTPAPWEVFDYEGMSDEPSVKLKPDECWGVKETSLRPVTLEWVEDENGIDGERQDVRINDPPLLHADAQLIADAPLLLAEVKRLREELFDTHAFYSIMEQKLAFAVGIKQGLLTSMSMDDLVDSMNRDYHDRLNKHMNGRLRK